MQIHAQALNIHLQMMTSTTVLNKLALTILFQLKLPLMNRTYCHMKVVNAKVLQQPKKLRLNLRAHLVNGENYEG